MLEGSKRNWIKVQLTLIYCQKIAKHLPAVHHALLSESLQVATAQSTHIKHSITVSIKAKRDSPRMHIHRYTG
jgi:hypothetical protein